MQAATMRARLSLEGIARKVTLEFNQLCLVLLEMRVRYMMFRACELACKITYSVICVTGTIII